MAASESRDVTLRLTMLLRKGQGRMYSVKRSS